MFDLRDYLEQSWSGPRKSEFVEKEMRIAERLISVEKSLGRNLTDSEKRTLAWIASRDPETAGDIQRIFDELISRSQRK